MLHIVVNYYIKLCLYCNMYLYKYYRKRRDNYRSHHRIYDLCCIVCVCDNDG